MSSMNMNSETISAKRKMYLNVLIGLFVLTAITLIQPQIVHMDFGSTILVQMVIAVLKTILILAFYMHLKHDDKVFTAIVIFTFAILLVVIVITATDIFYRGSPDDLFSADESKRGPVYHNVRSEGVTNE